jgi:copper resistance protein C
MLAHVAAIAALIALPAHASVIGTTPAPGDVVTEQPGTFSVVMNEQILSVEGADSANALQVTDASGRFYGDGCVTVDGDTISLDAQLGEAGDYALTFQVVSADGHPVSDTIDFSFEPAEGGAGAPGLAEAPECGVAAPAASAETGDADASAGPGTTDEGQQDQAQQDEGGAFPFLAVGVLAVLGVLAVIAFRANRLRGEIRERRDEGGALDEEQRLLEQERSEREQRDRG